MDEGLKPLAKGDAPGTGSGGRTLNLGSVRHTLNMVSYPGTPLWIKFGAVVHNINQFSF
jgi:hypothetical protein